MRPDEKISEIEGYVSELEGMMPESFEGYKSDLKTKAACERYFEKIVEAIIDLAFMIIKERNLRIPEEEKKSFDILAEEGMISAELAKKLKDAKGMRNILSHEYGKIDDEIVFTSITEDIESDAKEFIRRLRQK